MTVSDGNLSFYLGFPGYLPPFLTFLSVLLLLFFYSISFVLLRLPCFACSSSISVFPPLLILSFFRTFYFLRLSKPSPSHRILFLDLPFFFCSRIFIYVKMLSSPLFLLSDLLGYLQLHHRFSYFLAGKMN